MELVPQLDTGKCILSDNQVYNLHLNSVLLFFELGIAASQAVLGLEKAALRLPLIAVLQMVYPF